MIGGFQVGVFQTNFQQQAPTGDTHDLPERIPKKWANTQVLRESDWQKAKRLKKARQIPEAPEYQAPAYLEPPTEEEDLSLLLADEDERTIGLIEAASELIKKLH